MKLRKIAVGTAALAVASLSAKADTLSPSSFSATLGAGGSATVNKTVTVQAGTPTSSLVDVFFLADTTGSMSGSITSVRTSASTIVASTSGLGDVQYGVGEYKDVGDAFVYRLNQDLTASLPAIQGGINAWVAGGGGDLPEANLFGLKQVADTTSWRPGSARIVAWFGDAPGHDPSSGVTEADATAALVSNGVSVEAIDVGALDSTGQATRITAATGGHLHSGIASADVANEIIDAITHAFDTYATVSLDTSEVPLGLAAVLAPGAYVGAFDRSVDRDFGFGLTFVNGSLAPGTYTFNVYATVDGGRVATETDTITVPGTGVPDGGSSLALLGLGLAGLAGIRRKLAA